MKRMISLAVCIPLLSIAGAPRSAGAQAAPAEPRQRALGTFNDASLNDRYGFHTLALSLDPHNPRTGASVPFAISGFYRFHGDGTLNGRDVVSVQGQIVERAYKGTYHVNPDGTGSLILNIDPTFHPKGRCVITQDGEEIEIIFAVPGNLNTFTLRKQHAR